MEFVCDEIQKGRRAVRKNLYVDLRKTVVLQVREHRAQEVRMKAPAKVYLLYSLLSLMSQLAVGQKCPPGWQCVMSRIVKIQWKKSSMDAGYYDYEVFFTRPPLPGYGAVGFNINTDTMAGSFAVMCQAAGQTPPLLAVRTFNIAGRQLVASGTAGILPNRSTISSSMNATTRKINCTFTTNYNQLPVKYLIAAVGTTTVDQAGNVNHRYHGPDRARLGRNNLLIQDGSTTTAANNNTTPTTPSTLSTASAVTGTPPETSAQTSGRSTASTASTDATKTTGKTDATTTRGPRRKKGLSAPLIISLAVIGGLVLLGVAVVLLRKTAEEPEKPTSSLSSSDTEHDISEPTSTAVSSTTVG